MKRNAFLKFKVVLLGMVFTCVGIWGLVTWLSESRILEKVIANSIELGVEQSTGLHLQIQSVQFYPTLFHGLQLRLKHLQFRDLAQKRQLATVQYVLLGLRYKPLVVDRLPEIGHLEISGLELPMGKNNLFQSLRLVPYHPDPNSWLKDPVLKNTTLVLLDTRLSSLGVETFPGDDTGTVKFAQFSERFTLYCKHIQLEHLVSSKPLLASLQGQLQSDSHAIFKQPVHFKVGATFLPLTLSEDSVSLIHKLTNASLITEHTPNLPLSLSFKSHPNKQAILTLNSSGLSLKALQQVYRVICQSVIATVPAPKANASKTGASKASLSFQNKNQLPVVPGEIDGLLTLKHQLEIDLRPGHGRIKNWFGESWLKRFSWRQTSVKMLAKTTSLPPAIEHLTAHLVFKHNRVTLAPATCQVLSTPVLLTGGYAFDNLSGQLTVKSQALKISRLLQTAKAFSVSLPAMASTMDGNMSLDAKLSQAADTLPVLSSHAVFDQLSDKVAGLKNLKGTLTLNGQLLPGQRVAFQATGALAEGQFQNPAYGVSVSKLSGKVVSHGETTLNGTLQTPFWYNGSLVLQQGQFILPQAAATKKSQKSQSLQTFEGRLAFSPDRIEVQQFQSAVAAGRLMATGYIVPNPGSPQNSQYALHVYSTPLQLNALQPLLKTVAPQLATIEGTGQVNLQLKTGYHAFGTLSAHQVKLATTASSNLLLSIPSVAVQMNGANMTVPKTDLLVGSVPFSVAGHASGSKAYQFSVASSSIPVSFARDAAPLIEKLGGVSLPEIWNTAGSVSLTANLSDTETAVVLDCNQVGLSWKNGNLPIYNMTGKILFHQQPGKEPSIRSKDFQLSYGNSPFTVSLEQQQSFQALIKGILSPLTVNHFLVSHQSNAKPYNAIPFLARLSGKLGSLSPQDDKVEALVALDLDLLLQQASSLPWNQKESLAQSVDSKETIVKDKITPEQRPALANLEQSSAITRSYVEHLSPPVFLESGEALTDHAYLNLKANWQQGSLLIENALLNLFDAGGLHVTGSIDHLLDPARRIYVFQGKTLPAIDLKKLAVHTPENRFVKSMSGLITINSQLAFDTMGDKLANGTVALDQLGIPEMTLNNLNGKIAFRDETAQFSFDTIAIPGVDANFSGRTENLFQIPMTLTDVKLGGKFLSLDSLSAFNTNVVHPILVDELAHSFLRPWQQGDPTSPFQFRQADLHFDEVIFQNIILSQFNSLFSLFPNSFFELENTKATTAGGTISGYLSMNPNDNSFTTLELNVNHIKANALTKALLNVSDQVYGNMEGSIRFTTFGETDMDMQKNANGTVEIDIREGRLPAIAKVETLLTTANIFRGGLLGLNLNNLFRTLQFYETNYFAELKGDMQISNQVLYTNNLLSDGKNLDLLLQGNVKMDNGLTDMVINGEMRQTVISRLGLLGRLSLGEVVNVVPVIGNFGKNRAGLLHYVPGVGYFPGFGGSSKGKSRFQVRLNGLPGSQSSIQGFRWVD
jgi:hypothetical protein